MNEKTFDAAELVDWEFRTFNRTFKTDKFKQEGKCWDFSKFSKHWKQVSTSFQNTEGIGERVTYLKALNHQRQWQLTFCLNRQSQWWVPLFEAQEVKGCSSQLPALAPYPWSSCTRSLLPSLKSPFKPVGWQPLVVSPVEVARCHVSHRCEVASVASGLRATCDVRSKCASGAGGLVGFCMQVT